MVKILMFSGSVREASVNKKLIGVIASKATEAGEKVAVIDLADFPMPIYDGDFEEKEGTPDSVHALYTLIKEHDALVIASPEYNGLPAPLLKNAIDWVSRVDMNVFSGKVAAIVSASPGGLGGLRGLSHLRELLNNLGAFVVPTQLAVGGAYQAFDDNGTLKNDAQLKTIEKIIGQMGRVVSST